MYSCIDNLQHHHNNKQPPTALSLPSTSFSGIVSSFTVAPYYTCITYYICSFATILLQRLPETTSSDTYCAPPPLATASPPPSGGTTKPRSDAKCRDKNV
uniref:Uncharacterized protein n=1 Tax=Daucus carota subsp. sativus TaxID=79200 RepID=A0A175YE21_DAUCS